MHNKGTEEPVIDQYSALLLMAHDYKTDFSNLQKVLSTKAAYIGLLGPAYAAKKCLNALEADGHPVSEENRQRIFAQRDWI